MSKIIPINGRFESLAAYLGHIATDVDIVGIAGVVIRKCQDGPDGPLELVPIYLGADRGHIALAAAMLIKEATKDDDANG